MTDFGFLRTIPEDRSQVASSVAASNPSGIVAASVSDAPTSVRAAREGGSGSVVSDAMATLAGSGNGNNNNNNAGSGRGGGGGGGNARGVQPGDAGGGAGGRRAGRSGALGAGGDDNGSNVGVLPPSGRVHNADYHRRRPGGRRPERGVTAEGGRAKHQKWLHHFFCYWSRGKRRKACCWLLALLVSLAFIIAVVLLTTTPVRNPEVNASPTQSIPSQTPSYAPTAQPTPQTTINPETVDALDAILLTLVSPDDLYPSRGGVAGANEKSPQAQARDWMLEEDLRRDEVLADGPARVLQRYSLVVFFISTGRPDLLDGAQEECEWSGIHCEEPDSDRSNLQFVPNPGNKEIISNAQGVVGANQQLDTDLPGGTGTEDMTSGSNTGNTGSSGSAQQQALQQVVRGIILPAYNLTGVLPVELRALTSLGELHVPDNELVGEIPSEWFVLVPPPPSTGVPADGGLGVGTGTGGDSSSTTTTTTAVQVPGLYSLFWMDASRNNLSGSIPSGLWSLPFLRFVYLSQNDFTGALTTLHASPTTPEADEPAGGGLDGPGTSSSTGDHVLSALLEDVRIDHNRLTGDIPSWLLSRPTLRALAANHNEFNGTLPQDDSLQFAESLTALDLSNNKLTGPLPRNLFTTLAVHSTLHFVYLESNDFNGTLPSGNTTGAVLMDVWLHDNDLSGEIPPGFAHGWSNLTELLLHDNLLLTGSLDLPVLTQAPTPAPTLAPTAVPLTNANRSSTSTTTTTTVPDPDSIASSQPTCKSTWPMLQKMTADCDPPDAPVDCPCCTECF